MGVPEYSRYTSVCETVSTVEERLKLPKLPLSPNAPESLWNRFPIQMWNRIRDKKKRNTGESGASGEPQGGDHRGVITPLDSDSRFTTLVTSKISEVSTRVKARGRIAPEPPP